MRTHRRGARPASNEMPKSGMAGDRVECVRRSSGSVGQRRTAKSQHKTRTWHAASVDGNVGRSRRRWQKDEGGRRDLLLCAPACDRRHGMSSGVTLVLGGRGGQGCGKKRNILRRARRFAAMQGGGDSRGQQLSGVTRPQRRSGVVGRWANGEPRTRADRGPGRDWPRTSAGAGETLGKRLPRAIGGPAVDQVPQGLVDPQAPASVDRRI